MILKDKNLESSNGFLCGILKEGVLKANDAYRVCGCYLFNWPYIFENPHGDTYMVGSMVLVAVGRYSPFEQ